MAVSNRILPATGKRTRSCDDSTTKIEEHNAILLQIVTGSYERILHGVIASIKSGDTDGKVTFSDNFLLNAHSSAIRCLGLSPPSASSRILASGGTDERINLYQLSNHASNLDNFDSTNHTRPLSEKSAALKNKALGSLLHHSSAITALHFSSRSNLISTASDNTIAITRTKDWTMLQMLKAPIPRPVGRPSGDTAEPGEVPAGINDIAVHPTAKVMLTVGKGERCMRSWDLVRGKKAEVLTFDRELLSKLGEGRHLGSGEGRRICWDVEGEEYAVGFERGAAVFGLDSRVKGVIRPSPDTKIHQMHYIKVEEQAMKVLAISTEDGRILLYSTTLISAESKTLPSPPATPAIEVPNSDIPNFPMLAQLGGEDVTASRSRIKDFVFLPQAAPNLPSHVVSGSSDGAIRIWSFDNRDLSPAKQIGKPDQASQKSNTEQPGNVKQSPHELIVNMAGSQKQIGKLVGTYETGNRITCLVTFVIEP